MPILTLDIGNTQIKWGVYHHDQLILLERFATHPDQHEHARLKQFIQGFERHPNLRAVAVSSVVPSATADLKEAMASLGLSIPLLEAHPAQLQSNIQLPHYPVDQLGPDRWVNAVGALARFPEQSCLIIDFGTATTLDVVLLTENENENRQTGVFQGGIITPGLSTFSGILTQKTALLPPIPQVLPSYILGRNTLECLQSGIYLGYLNLISGLIQQIQERHQLNHQKKLMTLGTGGLSELYQHLCHSSEGRFPKLDQLCPELTLLGLKQLVAQNLNAHPASTRS
jgi:type III pantothenate kinase